jgi:hypothetical protein
MLDITPHSPTVTPNFDQKTVVVTSCPFHQNPGFNLSARARHAPALFR